ncbi:alpha/beta hydrolase [Roseiconus nitratireducens]|uniref:Alpha/beta hydrolase n=1 Tax=Roseiconus nitratireducens TaxID=2605748 RepID=A0A5M6CZR4_9BACT|nr:alpha/beta hydrolase [Roseiconus nitratireducens]KAA5540714.1 alpha/beta hydrolase [Roseiconus nitratireducens]
MFPSLRILLTILFATGFCVPLVDDAGMRFANAVESAAVGAVEKESNSRAASAEDVPEENSAATEQVALLERPQSSVLAASEPVISGADIAVLPTDTMDIEAMDTGSVDTATVDTATGELACLPDRVFLISTHHLAHDACCASLENPAFRIWKMECNRFQAIDLATYESMLTPERTVVIYVHGNRIEFDESIERGNSVRRRVRACRQGGPVDWVIFSWPSAREGLGLRDFREKADRCDAQGLYLAWFLRRHITASLPVAMIGYSFGGRVATGALHALAGGHLGGRKLPQPTITGAEVRLGLVAPALGSGWLSQCGKHRLATQNMAKMVLMYNRRDAVLKRYWLVEKIRHETALGFSGPTTFAPRFDGSRLPVKSRDCSPSVRIRHVELDYYNSRCRAGLDFAQMIQATEPMEF